MLLIYVVVNRTPNFISTYTLEEKNNCEQIIKSRYHHREELFATHVSEKRQILKTYIESLDSNNKQDRCQLKNEEMIWIVQKRSNANGQ